MKRTKNWKIVNYINTDVLFHKSNPRCIVARSEKEIRSDVASIVHEENHFYILHWLEDISLEETKSHEIIRDAVEAWKEKMIA